MQFRGSNPDRMARGKSLDPESPGFRRGLFVDVTHALREAPGGNPGTPGVKTIPPSMPDDGMQFRGSNPDRMARGKSLDPESPGFHPGLFVGVTHALREAPGGNPGTPGVKTIPPSMPDDGMQFRGSNPGRMARGKSLDPESPGFRRGLFVEAAC